MHWSRRDVLRAGLATGSAVLTGCGAGHRNALWHNDIYTRCIDPLRVTSPDTLGEIVQAVQRAAKERVRIRAVGAGHSFSDIAVVDGHLLRMGRLNQILPITPSTLKQPFQDSPFVRVEAGITVREINTALDCRGLALRNMGGWDAQTAAGVISTATHGSGLDFGSSSSFVQSMVLVTQDGKVMQIERTNGITDPARFQGAITRDGLHPAELHQDDDLFRSVVVSMGCMGVIYSVVVEVEPKYWLHEVREITTWEAIRRDDGYLGRLVRDGKPPPEATDGHGVARGEVPRHYEIYVNPYAHNGGHRALITKRFYRKEPPAAPCTQRGQLWLHIITAMDIQNPYLAVDAINPNPVIVASTIDLGFAAMAGCYDAVSYQVFNAGDVNRMAAYSVEPAVDLEQVIPAMDRLLQMAFDRLAAGKGVNAGPISLRFVQESKAFLAPQFGHPTAMLEIQALVGVKHMDDLLRAEERMLISELKARPHWGLDVGAIDGRSTLQAIYPRFDAWEKQFLRLNSAGVFNNEFTDRVGLSRSDAPPTARKKSDDCSR